MQKMILLTGASGFVGSNLLTRFVEDGFDVVCLLRANNGMEPYQRLRAVLETVSSLPGNVQDIMTRVRIVEGDITLPNLGLPEKEYGILKSLVSHVFHCAADTGFTPDISAAQRNCNVVGTENMVRFAEECEQVDGLHFVSTAYVAGNRTGVVTENELDQGQAFNNGYEKSKFLAEKLLQEHRSQKGLKITVYRPGIIVGHYQTGKTINFNGIYLFLRILHLLKRSYGNSNNNGKILVPLRVIGSPSVTKNFVPVDYVVNMIMQVFLSCRAHGGTFHIINHDPPRLGFVQEVIHDVLGITGTEFVGHDAFKAVPPKEIEEIFIRETEMYQAYMLKEPSFDNSGLKALPGGSFNCDCPPMDTQALTRLFEYAIKSKWGRNHRRLLTAHHRSSDTKQKKNPLSDTEKICRPVIDNYFKEFLPPVMGKSIFAELDNLNIIVSFCFIDIDKKWTLKLERGRLVQIDNKFSETSEVIYKLDCETFYRIVSGVLSPQQSFFKNMSRIEGDTLKGLKLAAIFDRFIKQYPFRLSSLQGVREPFN
jgi:thioester reductase-like protein